MQCSFDSRLEFDYENYENRLDDEFASIDHASYFRKLEREEEMEDEAAMKRRNARSLRLRLLCHTPQPTLSIPTPKRQRTQRTVGKRIIEYEDEDGNIQKLTPKKTFWYLYYVLSGKNFTQHDLKKFRKRFRLPYDEFLVLLADMEKSSLFSRWATIKSNVFQRGKSPLALLLLGALRYLGRGWTFDDIEEQTGINEETHRQFFHTFIEYGSSVLFNKHVVMPQTAEEAATHIRDMAIAGFPGCFGSTDATHIAMACCRFGLRQSHKGHKLPYPSRTYNLTANHRRRILYTTSGHPARWNDKTLQRFDVLMNGIQSGDLLDDVQFELYDTNESGEVIKVQYKGAWVIVDNGYLCWSTCIPPMKHAMTTEDIRFSEWVESMRKDVECTFGILKGRWRILKTPIRVHGVETVDKIWKTCCALHNRLLEVDGLDKDWGPGVRSDWEGSLGRVPFAIERLHNTHRSARHRDNNGMGVGTDEDVVGATVNESCTTEVSKTGINLVRNLSQSTFRAKLIKHFDISFKRHEVIWPKRKPKTASATS